MDNLVKTVQDTEKWKSLIAKQAKKSLEPSQEVSIVAHVRYKRDKKNNKPQKSPQLVEKKNGRAKSTKTHGGKVNKVKKPKKQTGRKKVTRR